MLGCHICYRDILRIRSSRCLQEPSPTEQATEVRFNRDYAGGHLREDGLSGYQLLCSKVSNSAPSSKRMHLSPGKLARNQSKTAEARWCFRIPLDVAGHIEKVSGVV